MNRGIGLLSAIALLTIVALSLAVMAPAVYQLIASDSTLKITSNLGNLKTAITGNPRLLIQGGRADFGYIGTMGSVPTALSKLWLAGSQSAYSFSTPKKVGAGWVGPYIPNVFVEDLLSFDKDLFGSPYIYTSTPFTRSSDGQLVAARILSAGADGLTGTTDDMFVDILKGEIFSTVTGTLVRGTQPVPFASVTLNKPINTTFPSEGVVGTAVTTTDSNGVFTFTDVPFGFRSVSVDPKLTYEPNSASVQSSRTLKFTITNFAEGNLTITSLTATYSAAIYYKSIKFGNSTVFDSTTPRAQSGQTITFSSSQVVDGSGKPSQVIPVRVDQETTTTPDLVIRGVGRSVVVQLQDFNTALTGAGSNANPSGVTFTINFNDGSQNTFTAP